MLFYIGFIVFILSLIGGLVLMFVGKNMGKDRFRLIATIHIVLLLAFIASLILRKDYSVVINNYFFTAFFCSGVLLSGLVWRIDIAIFIRYYFSLFLLGIPLFLFSPSRMMNFLVTTHYSSTTGKTFLLTGRYFMEEQGTVQSADNSPHYKVIIKSGFFYKTVQRDLVFGGVLDSVRVLDLNDQTLLIRGFTSTKSYVSDNVDSADVEIQLKKNKPGDVEYRL
jgi:hypothetical protein